MATDAEIREWARGEGIEVPARGRLAPTFRERYDQAHPVDDDQAPGQLSADDMAVDDQAPAEQRPTLPAGLAPAGDGTPEKAPTSPHRPRLTLLGGGRRQRAPKPAARSRRRVSLESTAAGAWELLASAAARSGLTPTARVLGMQAPVAGVILEDALRGTVVDRVLQPLARMGDKGGSVVALLAPPVLVSVATMYPQRAEEILPMLRACLRQWALVAGPAIKEREKRERKAAEALELPDGQTVDDLVDSWIAGFWQMPDQAMPDAA